MMATADLKNCTEQPWPQTITFSFHIENWAVQKGNFFFSNLPIYLDVVKIPYTSVVLGLSVSKRNTSSVRKKRKKKKPLLSSLIYDFIPVEVNSSFVSDANGKKQTYCICINLAFEHSETNLQISSTPSSLMKTEDRDFQTCWGSTFLSAGSHFSRLFNSRQTAVGLRQEFP